MLIHQTLREVLNLVMCHGRAALVIPEVIYPEQGSQPQMAGINIPVPYQVLMQELQRTISYLISILMTGTTVI